MTVVGFAMAYRTERRETTEYLALIGDAANSEIAVAESLQDLFASLNGLDRPAILSRLATINEQADRIEATMAEAVVTRPVASVHGYFAVAVDSWHGAMAEMEDAIIEVMDQPSTTLEELVDADRLSEAFDLLRIGDHAYRSFLEAVAVLDIEVEAPTFPTVAFLGAEHLGDVQAIASQLRLSRNLDERRDVEITANTSPEPAGNANGILAMPFSERFDVTAVVTNSGNVMQEGIDVTLELRRDGDTGDPLREARIIAALGPQTSETIEFVGLALEPGSLYTLQITADIADDASVDNNVWKITFATNTG